MIQSNFFENKGFSQSETIAIHAFDAYLSTTTDKQIIVFTSKPNPYGPIIKIPYTTRWSPAYKKKMVTKMYGVQEYLTKKSAASVVTLLTLTGYQNGKTSIAHTGSTTTRTQLFEKLKIGWRHLSNIIQKELPNLEYVWVMEPHKSGYPHIHIALFGHIPKDIQLRLTNLWTEKYQIGSAKHGINFEVKSVKESIKSVKNYLLKYISKGIGADGRRSWSPEEFNYHAIAWKHHHRYIGMSQSISRYCTARKLRYRYIKHTYELTNQFIPTSELPTDKNGLKRAIKFYKDLPGVDPPDPDEPQWHYSFIIDKGTLSIIHQKETQSIEIITWINNNLTLLLKYKDNFIPLPQPQQT